MQTLKGAVFGSRTKFRESNLAAANANIKAQARNIGNLY